MRASFRLQASVLLFAIMMPFASGHAAEGDGDATEESLRQDIQTLSEELADATDEQQERLMADIEDVLGAIDARIATLENRLEEEWTSADKLARAKAQTAVAHLRRERARVMEWYERMQDSTGVTWESMKDSFDQALDKLSGAWQDAEQNVREAVDEDK
ncbi:sll1863 family stress response protein [Marinobacter confluentis]|uniref:Uncharacterized protein n=1 Tax=Marinobacter confluentis TaxID=1697557 RepID=A0A4Z1BKK8_9GAMM|nr:hypothetical protein [Marinobacter confluentis]TGN40267.1 hypothetical protein E5Q11_08265 [Marinobacter confluentis]